MKLLVDGWSVGLKEPVKARVDARHRMRVGRLGEERAAAYFEALGYRIEDRRWRCRGGELDLVVSCRRLGRLVFVEVRTRTRARFERPQDSVGFTKRRYIRRAARHWLDRHPEWLAEGGWDVSFDVVGVVLEKSHVEHIPNAFAWCCEDGSEI